MERLEKKTHWVGLRKRKVELVKQVDNPKSGWWWESSTVLVHFSTVGVGLNCALHVVEERAVCTARNPIYKLCLYSVHSVS